MPINLRRLSPSSFAEPGRFENPTVRLDPAAAAAPYRALAAGATAAGAAINDAFGAFDELEKEKRKLERASTLSQMVSEAETRFYDFESVVKRSGGPREVDPTGISGETAVIDPILHKTYATTIDAGLSRIIEQTAKSTQDGLVQDEFLKKMRVFGVARYHQARTYQDKLFVDYHEGVLVETLDHVKHGIFRVADERGVPAALIALDSTSKLFDQYRPLLGDQTTEKRSKEFRESAGGALARRAMFDDPLGFLPTAQRGGGMNEKFEKYVKPEYMVTLNENASKEAERRVISANRDADRSARQMEKSLHEQAQTWASRVFQQFANAANPQDNQSSQPPSSAFLTDGLDLFGHSLPIDTQRAIIDLRDRPNLHGGTTNRSVQNDIRIRIVADDPSLSPASIMSNVPGQLSVSDAVVLTKELEQRRREDDVSKDPFYAAGVRQINVRMGVSDIAQMFSVFRMSSNEARRYGDALLEFEATARDMKKRGKPLDSLPDLASKIADRILLANPGGTQPPGRPAPAAPGQNPPAVKTPAAKSPRDKTIPR